MILSLIVAVSQNNVIGSENKLPWHIPEDLKKFKEITADFPMIMGRKTFESLPRVLSGRDHYVITRNSNFKSENPAANKSDKVYVFNSVNDAIEKIKTSDYEKVFIIGGGEIYKQTIDFCDFLYITEIKMDIKGDTFFPQIDPEKWKEIQRDEFEGFDFVVYKKI
jgi:dihydrofolate reductase